MTKPKSTDQKRTLAIIIAGLLVLIILAVAAINSRKIISFLRRIEYVGLPPLNTTIVDSKDLLHNLDASITLEVPKEYLNLINGNKLIMSMDKACKSIIYEELDGTNGIELLKLLMEIELNKALPVGVSEQIKVHIHELIIDDRLPSDKNDNPNKQAEIFDGLFYGK